MMFRNPIRRMQEHAVLALLARMPVAGREEFLTRFLAGLPKDERERVLVAVPGFAVFATAVMQAAATSARRPRG